PDVETATRLLAGRRMNWFDEGVVPVLAASVQSTPRTLPLNLPAADAVGGVPDDAIVEMDCEISSAGIHAIPAPPLPKGPWEITLQLLDLERAVLSRPEKASADDLAEALDLHPLMRGHDIRRTAAELARLI